MTFTLRSLAFCFFIHIIIICHEIPQLSVCLHQVVLCEEICIACDVLFIFATTSLQCRCNITTLQRHCNDVVRASVSFLFAFMHTEPLLKRGRIFFSCNN